MLNIAILSVNHQHAPVAIREKVAFAQSELAPTISSLLSTQEIKACVVFSTCNRSEIYVTYDAENIREVLTKFLASIHGIEYSSLLQYVSYFEGNEAIEHICNVAAGLDSLVLGEPQIFGQLKEAYHRCREASGDGPFREADCFEKAYLIHLFQEMLEAGTLMSPAETRGGYIEIDTQEDLDYARKHWRTTHLGK